MPQGLVKLDVPMILNMLKNDRHFTITKGVPRDTYAVDSWWDEKEKRFNIIVESEGIPKSEGELPVIDIEVFGNADAVDEKGILVALKPATVIK